MITAFEIYLVSKLDVVLCVSMITVFLGAMATFFNWDLSNTEFYSEEERKKYRKRLPFLIAVTLFGFFLVLITPSTKTAYKMYVIPKIANNEKVQQLPDVFLDYIIEEFTVEKK